MSSVTRRTHGPHLYIPGPHLTVKRAAGDHDGDTPFEQSFSNVALAYVQDAAPGLLDYMIGFQLLDRDDDSDKSKAVGLFGFKVGQNWLYAPVFWLNGQLKGNELLYIKGQDSFVPLKQNWIDYLLAKKPASLGQGVDRNTRGLGVHYPDMFRALQSPRKYASASRVGWAPGERAALRAAADAVRVKSAAAAALPDWAAVGVAAMAASALRPDRPFEPGLPRILKRAGARGLAALHTQLRAYPRLRPMFDEVYDRDAVKEAAVYAAEHRPPNAPRRFVGSVVGKVGDPLKSGKLEVHTFSGDFKKASVLLNAADREALVRDGLLIKDAREDGEVSEAYAVPTRVEFEKVFRNPTEGGVYDVLTSTGDTAKCLVVIGPSGPDRTYPFATVVALDADGGRRKWVNVHQSYVWVGREYKGWRSWYDGLPEAESVPVSESYDKRLYYMAVGPRAQGTVPFCAREDQGRDAGGGRVYRVDFDVHADRERAGGGSGPHPVPYRYDDYDAYAVRYAMPRVHLGQETGTKLTSHRGELYVPAGYKKLALTAVEPPDEKEPDRQKEQGMEPADRDVRSKDQLNKDEPSRYDHGELQPYDSKLRLGDALDLETNILRKRARLKVAHDGSQYAIAGVCRPERAALLHLVAGRGFRRDVAEAMLKAAAGLNRRSPGAAATFLVKYADPYSGQERGDPYLTQGGPHAPNAIDPMYGHDDVMGSAVAAQHPYEDALDVPDMRADPRNRDAYDPVAPDPMASQVAQDAAGRGQREVFDSAMIGNLLKATRDDTDDSDLSEMMECLDKIGRRLFALYWHGDQYAERYGKSDLPELEDSLRNTFFDLGELVLFLKQRGVEPGDAESARTIDLDEVADQ